MSNLKIHSFLSFLVLFYVDCRSAPEPLCSKFSYDEQLLEKMVRVEFNVNNMEKTMLETEKNMRKVELNMTETEKNMKETENNMRKVELEMTETEKRMKETEKNMLETQKNMLTTLSEIADKMKLMKVLEQKEAALDALTGKDVVAFHAYKVADRSLANNQVIVFTKVLMNEGDSYSSNNGYFTAPVNGIYYFNAHLCVYDGKILQYIIVMDGQTQASGVYKPYGHGTCTSFSVTVLMHSGERTWVTIDSSGSSSSNLLYEDSDDWNYFSGFLIRQTN